MKKENTDTGTIGNGAISVFFVISNSIMQQK